MAHCQLNTRLVETLIRFLALHPANGDEDAALRLVMELLELADVAPQPEIARAVGYSQDRSVRLFKVRLQEQGLGGLSDRPSTGRPAVTSQPAVERAVVQAILEAVITGQALPDDEALAQAVNGYLAEAQEPWEVTASMVETIRLRLGIQRPILAQQLQATNDSQPSVQEQMRLGRTKAGGAFILAVLLAETGWLKLADLLPMAPGYAVTAAQWLLTAIFAVIYNVRRAFHLDDMRDIGFGLITGRARPLSRSTFQHLLHAIPAEAARRCYEATARLIVQGLKAGVRRISLDGHNLPRYTKVVDVIKGKIGNAGRVLKAEEMVLALYLAVQDKCLRPGCLALAGSARLPGQQEVEPGALGDGGRTTPSPRGHRRAVAHLLRQGRLQGPELPGSLRFARRSLLHPGGALLDERGAVGATGGRRF